MIYVDEVQRRVTAQPWRLKVNECRVGGWGWGLRGLTWPERHLRLRRSLDHYGANLLRQLRS